MKRLTTLIALLAALSISAVAQTRPSGTNGTWRIAGYVLTTAQVSLCTLTASASIVPPPCNAILYVCTSDVNASAGTAATVTIADALGNAFWTTVAPLSSSAASSYNIPVGTYPFCRPFPAGMLVSASAGSTITFAASGYY